MVADGGTMALGGRDCEKQELLRRSIEGIDLHIL